MNKAFTLAETLITLVILGVIAALTMPALMAKCEKMILKNQFKKAYSVLSNAMNNVVFENGGNVSCYYEDSNTSNVTNECKFFWTSVFSKANIIKECISGAAEKGCVPQDYFKDTQQSPNCNYFSESYIKNSNYAYITADGVMYMPYNKNQQPVLMIDVNGPFKNPNTVGKDIFAFQIFSNFTGGNLNPGFSSINTNSNMINVCLVLPTNHYFSKLSDLLE